MDKLRVIFHIDECERWKMVLGNVSNLLKEVSENEIDIEVLANGKAVIGYLKENVDGDKFTKLLSQGVKFSACNNSLNNLDIKISDLIDGVEVVPAGVLELARRQSEGYGYIKP